MPHPRRRARRRRQHGHRVRRSARRRRAGGRARRDARGSRTGAAPSTRGPSRTPDGDVARAATALDRGDRRAGRRARAGAVRAPCTGWTPGEKARLLRAMLAGVPSGALAFELSPRFAPHGEIWDDETFARILELPSLVGAKHSSLDRETELGASPRATAAARLPRLHRQRPRHRHGGVRQRLPARPLHLHA